jgi:hypothetical protein
VNQIATDRSEFERLFYSQEPARDAFRSRLFGLFSEEIVRHWCANDLAPYRDLGRPTVWSGKDFATLDFMLQSRADERRFVAELKAEMAFEKYRYLRLTDPTQLTHHAARRAFAWLLEVASEPECHVVKLATKPTTVSGAILVWGTTDVSGRAAVMMEYGFADVLSLEQMLTDLSDWADPRWLDRVDELRSWTYGLFDGLTRGTRAVTKWTDPR